MKISEMTNDQASEAMIRLSKPISNICDDDEIVELFKEAGDSGEKPLMSTIGVLLPRAVTLAFIKHRDDLYEIVGALLMVPTTKVGGMNFAETLKAVKDSYDDVLAGFFTQSKPVTRKKGGK